MSALARRPERRRRRFVFAAMHSPFALPVLSASLLASIALGVHLGQSSISQINPIYFEAPPVHPRDRGVAVDEASLRRTPDPYLQYYGWEQGRAALASECTHCGARPLRDPYAAYSAEVPYFGSRSELRQAVSDARDELGDEFASVPEDLSARVQPIERYAHYPVTVEQPKDNVEIVAEAAPEPVTFEASKDFRE
jgi:hypothetical protein